MRSAMMVVKCKYCDIKCRPINENGSNMWQCDYHGAVRVRYLYLGEDRFTMAYLILYNNKSYYMWFLPFNDNIKFRIDKINPPPKTSETIMSLDFVPNIKPEEAASKLITYMMFS